MRAFSYARARSVEDLLAAARDGDVTLMAGAPSC
jgi:CO/xanthine dehydrogenase FAD-binding subunit